MWQIQLCAALYLLIHFLQSSDCTTKINKKSIFFNATPDIYYNIDDK